MKIKKILIIGLLLSVPITLSHYKLNFKRQAPKDVLSLTPLSPLSKDLKYDEQDKILAELMAQQIFTQQCSDSHLCNYVPVKNISVLKFKKMDYKKIKDYQKLSYEENISLLKRESGSNTIDKVNLFMQGSCPRNTAAAWLKKNESETRLNKPDLIKKVYNFVAACKPVEDHEEMYLRQALYFYHENNIIEAKEAITRALTISKNEKMRINYWAGKILKESKYYEVVMNNYPYSFHAIESAKELNQDLFQNILKRQNYSNDQVVHEFVEIVKMLLYFEQYEALDKLMRLNVSNININNQAWFYINRLVKTYAPTQYTIWLVARLSQNRADYLNNQVLQLVYEKHYFDSFTKQALLFNLDPYLLLSLSKQESGFNYKAQSSAKARGLMQLLPSTAKHISRVTAEQLFDPEINIQVGTKYFNELLVKYQSVEAALAAYNAGPRRVEQWMKIYSDQNKILFMDLIPFKETRSYIGLILRNHYYYKKMNKNEEK